MSSRPSRSTDTSGFTLIEVLVAFVVMATLLSVLYRGVVTLHQGANAFDDHTDRELVARAVLDEVLAERDFKPGTHHGVRDGRRWTVVAKPIDLSAQLPPPAQTNDQQAPSAPGQTSTPAQTSATGQTSAPGQPGQTNAPGQQTAKREWTMQRLTVRIDSPGRPIEIQTLRMVGAEP